MRRVEKQWEQGKLLILRLFIMFRSKRIFAIRFAARLNIGSFEIFHMNDGTNANKMNLKPWGMAKFETVAHHVAPNSSPCIKRNPGVQ